MKNKDTKLDIDQQLKAAQAEIANKNLDKFADDCRKRELQARKNNKTGLGCLIILIILIAAIVIYLPGCGNLWAGKFS